MKTSKIKKITKLSKKYDRYDLTVSTTNNFYANGVLIHNTSAIFGNILTKAPKWGGLYSKVFPYLPKFLQFGKEEFGLVYSSRTVIKNKYINSKATDGFYGTDIWGEYAALLDGKIPEGMMLYGEIVGYLTGSQKMIQKDYDYGCPVGTNKLMLYRITTENEDGTKREWEIQEVYDWTLQLVKDYPELEKYIHPIDILYIGTLQQLYPDIDVANHWHENVLEAMKKDKKTFGMELNEPLCKKKVPREGIVIRKVGDMISEAWKLKCSKFLMAEGESITNAEINGDEYEDLEMSEHY